MDPRLNKACVTGDVTTIFNLFQENNSILSQTTVLSNTALHLASRLGHFDLVKKIIELKPELVLAENIYMETPLYEACREGREKIVMLLLQADYTVSYRRNRDKESVLLVACSLGHLDVVRVLVNMTDVHRESTNYFHVAASNGYTGIVQEILRKQPRLALRRDENGFSPLHLASRKGHLETTGEFLKANSDLCFVRDNNGRTPLHLAAIRGHVNVINEIISESPESALMQTQQGETVLHLSVMHNQYKAVKSLVKKLCIINIVNLPDNNGNTALHYAAIGKLSDITKLLLSKNRADVKAVNKNGLTALDILNEGQSDAELTVIIKMLMPAKLDNNSVSLPASDESHSNNSSFKPCNCDN
ncbi:uncharacterized protein LOC143846593 [Tasmannia lanceolata]|uniref:uncharacterized protein LOC143846593 n=1 Tax=Tasmannia lanceolata TaxID=3420 RepID=UPI0040631A2F